MSETAAETLWQPSMFSAADFRVNPTPLLADVKALKTNGTCGRSSPDSFASLDPDGSWRKTCQGYSQLTLDGSLERFCETWPRAGMTRNGIAYLLPPSVPLTDVTACGWLPTPAATSYGTNQGGAAGRVGPVRPSLETMARSNLWPTPQAEYDSGKHRGKPDTLHSAVKMWPTPSTADAMGGKIHSDNAHQRRKVQVGLNYAVKKWPTPTVQDASNNAGSSQLHRNSLPPNAAVGGSLNPTWVEWLMGYPLGWTA